MKYYTQKSIGNDEQVHRYHDLLPGLLTCQVALLHPVSDLVTRLSDTFQLSPDQTYLVDFCLVRNLKGI